jgi:hypothetical protein
MRFLCLCASTRFSLSIQSHKLYRAAGSDTTSKSTTAIIVQLVNAQKKLDRLVEEIDLAFPSIDEDITFTKLQELPYLNAVIWEGMRVIGAPAGTFTRPFLFVFQNSVHTKYGVRHPKIHERIDNYKRL